MEESELLRSDTLFVGGLNAKTDDERRAIFSFLGEMGLSWQGLPDMQNLGLSPIEDGADQIRVNLEMILGNEEYALAPVSLTTIKDFADQQGKSTTPVWAYLLKGIEISQYPLPAENEHDFWLRRRLETMPNLSVFVESPTEYSTEVVKRNPNSFRDNLWLPFRDIVSLVNWLESESFIDPGTQYRRLPIYGMGVKSLDFLKSFVAHYAAQPDELLLLQKPDSREIPVPKLNGSEYGYDSSSPYIDHFDVGDKTVDIVSTASVKRYAHDLGIDPKRTRRLHSIMDQFEQRWRSKLWREMKSSAGNADVPSDDFIELDPNHFFHVVDDAGKPTILLSVPKFLETIHLLCQPSPYNEGLFRPIGLGPANLELLCNYAKALIS